MSHCHGYQTGLPPIDMQVSIINTRSPYHFSQVCISSTFPACCLVHWGGHGNLLQYSWLENAMDRGAWWAVVHRVAKSQTRLKQQHTHTSMPSTCRHSIISHGQMGVWLKVAWLRGWSSCPQGLCTDLWASNLQLTVKRSNKMNTMVLWLL